MDTINTFELSKEQFADHGDKQTDLNLEDSGYSPTQKLALTCRILFDNGHDSGLAGQTTARGIDRNTFTHNVLASALTRSAPATSSSFTNISRCSRAKAWPTPPIASTRGNIARAQT